MVIPTLTDVTVNTPFAPLTAVNSVLVLSPDLDGCARDAAFCIDDDSGD
jgi:hypothetical protein